MYLSDKDIKDIFALQGCTLDKFELDHEKQEVKIHVHLFKKLKNRCPVCGRECKGYDKLTRERKWRALDSGVYQTFIFMDTHRIKCPEHGVLTEAVPFAFHKSRFTKLFEKHVCYLARTFDKKALTQIMRIRWETVGKILQRVWEIKEPHLKSRFDNLKVIGIDETSYKKGHKYLTIVLNMENGEVLYCAKGHDKETLAKFFEMLTPEQRASIEFVAGDAARWIKSTSLEYCPNATFCLDKFHIMKWAVEAVNKVRLLFQRELQALLKEEEKSNPSSKKRKEKTPEEKAITSSKYALGMRFNPERYDHIEKLIELKIYAPKVFKAWQLKELLAAALSADSYEEGKAILEAFLSWGCRCRIEPMVKLTRTIREHKDEILNTIYHGITSAQVEAVNNKIKLIQKKAYGFRNIETLIDIIMLFCSEIGKNLKPVYSPDEDFDSEISEDKDSKEGDKGSKKH